MTALIRVPLGVAIMVVGFLAVWRTEKVLVWVGQIDWAEQKFGSGGTRFFVKLLGVGVAFLGIFVATDIISDILGSLAAVFIRKPSGG